MVYRAELYQIEKNNTMKDKIRIKIVLKVIKKVYDENLEKKEIIDTPMVKIYAEEGVKPVFLPLL